MNFLPSDYEAPHVQSGYMKFQDGENKFRILSSPILGWEDWLDKKPIRYPMNAKPEKPFDAKQPIKHFWAFIVWNYAANKIQILEIIQASIRNRLEALSKDADWGSPFLYDIKVVKKGQQVETKYEVNPISPKELDPKIKEEFYKTPIDLEELFKGGDPFSPHNPPTAPFWEKRGQEVPSQPLVISAEKAEAIEREIAHWITPSDPNWKNQVLTALKISSFASLPVSLYETLMSRIETRKNKILQEEIPF